MTSFFSTVWTYLRSVNTREGGRGIWVSCPPPQILKFCIVRKEDRKIKKTIKFAPKLGMNVRDCRNQLEAEMTGCIEQCCFNSIPYWPF